MNNFKHTCREQEIVKNSHTDLKWNFQELKINNSKGDFGIFYQKKLIRMHERDKSKENVDRKNI